jgi:hypothetical protein
VYAPFGARLDWKGSALEADRGERAGKYATILEIPSVEQRNHFFSAESAATEEAKRQLGPEFNEMTKKVDTYVAGAFTDYIEQGKQK